MIVDEKERVIAQALESHYGRLLLAHAMADPMYDEMLKGKSVFDPSTWKLRWRRMLLNAKLAWYRFAGRIERAAMPPPRPRRPAPPVLPVTDDSVLAVSATDDTIYSKEIVFADESLRHEWISTDAYFRAEREGFPPGREDEFWAAAEREFHERYKLFEGPPDTCWLKADWFDADDVIYRD